MRACVVSFPLSHSTWSHSHYPTLHGLIPIIPLYMVSFPLSHATWSHSHAPTLTWSHSHYPTLHGLIPIIPLYMVSFPLSHSTWSHSHYPTLHGLIPIIPTLHGLIPIIPCHMVSFPLSHSTWSHSHSHIQFQSFVQFRGKLKSRSSEEIQTLKDTPKVWNIHSMLNVFYSLIEKSNINEQVTLEKGSKSPKLTLAESTLKTSRLSLSPSPQIYLV